MVTPIATPYIIQCIIIILEGKGGCAPPEPPPWIRPGIVSRKREREREGKGGRETETETETERGRKGEGETERKRVSTSSPGSTFFLSGNPYSS